MSERNVAEGEKRDLIGDGVVEFVESFEGEDGGGSIGWEDGLDGCTPGHELADDTDGGLLVFALDIGERSEVVGAHGLLVAEDALFDGVNLGVEAEAGDATVTMGDKVLDGFAGGVAIFDFDEVYE